MRYQLSRKCIYKSMTFILKYTIPHTKRVPVGCTRLILHYEMSIKEYDSRAKVFPYLVLLFTVPLSSSRDTIQNTRERYLVFLSYQTDNHREIRRENIIFNRPSRRVRA